MESIPDRRILDFLVQFFVAEVNWYTSLVRRASPISHKADVNHLYRMSQLVHAPWFLKKYQGWLHIRCATLVSELDFTILILRICSYTLQFLPSPICPIDRIHGILLSDLQTVCDETSTSLEVISAAADGRASLLRVQQIAFLGLKFQIEGNTDSFSETLGRAIRVAQSGGMNNAKVRSHKGIDHANREMERRTICSLYVWDSQLSRQLDRAPFFYETLLPETLPQLHLLESKNEKEAEVEPCIESPPDVFAERLLQVQLANFWRGICPAQGTEYDVMAAEERYEKFCRDFLSHLPPIFDLVDPNKAWDRIFPKLPLQRKQLHVAIYESLCWNFRPLLLHRPLHLSSCRAVIFSSQVLSLAAAALQIMESVTQLHALLGGCHTRLTSIPTSTFEAAVVLLYLLIDPSFPVKCVQSNEYPHDSGAMKYDPLQARTGKVTRHRCLQAAQGALKRLQVLAEVSSMADLGARILSQLFGKLAKASIEAEVTYNSVTGKLALILGEQEIRKEARQKPTSNTLLKDFQQLPKNIRKSSNGLRCDLVDLPPVEDIAEASGSLLPDAFNLHSLYFNQYEL